MGILSRALEKMVSPQFHPLVKTRGPAELFSSAVAQSQEHPLKSTLSALKGVLFAELNRTNGYFRGEKPSWQIMSCFFSSTNSLKVISRKRLYSRSQPLLSARACRQLKSKSKSSSSSSMKRRINRKIRRKTSTNTITTLQSSRT